MKRFYQATLAFLLGFGDYNPSWAADESPSAAACRADPACVTVQKEINDLIARGEAVKELDLGKRNLKTLPPEIEKLTSLEELSVYKNQLSALPAEIGKLTNLKKLLVSDNQLSALPPEIGNLTNLKELYVSDNKLSALPPEIERLTSLKKLVLGKNQLSALPPEIEKLINLKELFVTTNKLSALPPEIGKLTNLEVLYVNENQISALPASLNRPGLLISGFNGKFEDAATTKDSVDAAGKTPEQSGTEIDKSEGEKPSEKTDADEEMFKKWMNE
jgi:Leucine-rich repeat (LRR) protein